jgi:hypothetical protein
MNKLKLLILISVPIIFILPLGAFSLTPLILLMGLMAIG